MQAMRIVHRLAHRTIEAVTERLPPSVAGWVDLLRPALRQPWGGPMNGQLRRQQLVRELALAHPFGLVVETGTHRGATTGFLADTFGTPVVTVEADRRLFAYSTRRLAPRPTIDVRLGDSPVVLEQVARELAATSGPLFAYLDAHWGPELPLAEELEVLAARWPRVVVMIDDFAVPDDAGYGFDDYGPDKVLNAGYLGSVALEGWSLSYPAAHSSSESGARRGCCVLASPSMTDVVRIPGLRGHQQM